MQIKQAERLTTRLENGRRVLVEIDCPTSKYHGSIVVCHVDPYYTNYYHPTYTNFQISAPELTRKLNFTYLNLDLTKETNTKLTSRPAFKKRIDVRDFSKRIVEVHDILFGEDKLIRIDSIVPSGTCHTTCIKAVKTSDEGKTRCYRSFKRYVWIEDPTMLILTLS